MSAAILQGCPATTLDTDLWIDLPSRQYMRVLRLCQRLGAAMQANKVVVLTDGSMVNFLYRVDGPPKKEKWGVFATFKDSEGNPFVLSSSKG
jgi:hypothetical protein